MPKKVFENRASQNPDRKVCHLFKIGDSDTVFYREK
jgi:hypothetical protein